MKPTTKTAIIAIIAGLAAFGLIIFAVWLLTLGEDNEDEKEKDNIVTRIIDGDTFQLSNNGTVRLICVDAPEKGKTGADESASFLSEMILDKPVRLEKDKTEEDEYGRLLRYVYVNISGVELFVNQQLVQEGYAKLFRYGNDTTKCDEIEFA